MFILSTKMGKIKKCTSVFVLLQMHCHIVYIIMYKKRLKYNCKLYIMLNTIIICKIT